MVGFVVVGLDGSRVNLGQGTGVGTGRKWGLAGDRRGVRSGHLCLFAHYFQDTDACFPIFQAVISLTKSLLRYTVLFHSSYSVLNYFQKPALSLNSAQEQQCKVKPKLICQHLKDRGGLKQKCTPNPKLFSGTLSHAPFTCSKPTLDIPFLLLHAGL